MGTRMTFELTEEQTARYLEWARRTQAEDEPLPAVTVAFTLTNLGAHVVASRGEIVFRGGSILVLQDVLDPLPDPVRWVGGRHADPLVTLTPGRSAQRHGSQPAPLVSVDATTSAATRAMSCNVASSFSSA